MNERTNTFGSEREMFLPISRWHVRRPPRPIDLSLDAFLHELRGGMRRDKKSSCSIRRKIKKKKKMMICRGDSRCCRLDGSASFVMGGRPGRLLSSVAAISESVRKKRVGRSAPSLLPTAAAGPHHNWGRRPTDRHKAPSLSSLPRRSPGYLSTWITLPVRRHETRP